MASADIIIVGAGVVGLSLALELRRRGVAVTLLERGRAGAEASSAAAGMLAADDPANPPQLLPLAAHSLALYPEFLAQLRAAGAGDVPFETEWTIDLHGDGPGNTGPLSSMTQAAHLGSLRPERSLDPRKLMPALTRAVRASGVSLLEDTLVLHWSETEHGIRVTTPSRELAAGVLVDCTGAWSADFVRPAKGQMLRIDLPPGSMHLAGRGNVVLRSPGIYIVPRLDGSAILGATIEDAGFDLQIHEDAIRALHHRAASLLPALQQAPELERWAGLRPRTADGLPLLGRTGSRLFVASGHFRNGILLAPATARVMAGLILGEPAAIDLAPFTPARLHTATEPVLAPA